jgi:tetratricopeptide (TPR) repeat protein
MSAVTDAMIMRVGGVVPVRYGLQVMRTGVDEGIIGRDHPVAVLRAEIGRATASHGGLVLVTGEAGIGKSALVTQAAQEARRGGVLVVGGSCWDSDSAPGYWPWVQVMRMLRRGDAGEWAAAREAGGIGLAVLFGERRGEDDEQRVDPFALRDAVTGALVAVSRQRPVMVVLDDLHGADPASLRLLTFAAQHTWFERVLLVGTYRDVEVEATDHPLRPLMTPLVAKATTLTLAGLGRDDVGTLIARTAGRRPDAAIVDEIHRRTGGNPFFVEQTARLWRADGETAAVAPGVRDAVRQRLSRLPPAVDAVLTAAAVLGREFHRQVLAAAAAQQAARVDRLLDQAATARLVGALGGGRFRFAHDLVRETLYDGLDEPTRRRAHAAVIRAVDDSPRLAERLFPADLARHAYLAGAELPAARAVDLLAAAGRDASARMSSEEAITQFERALEVVYDPRSRARVTLELGQMLFHRRDRDDAWAQLARAADDARALDDVELLTRVALTAYRNLGLRRRRLATVDALLREARRRLIGEDADPGASHERLVRDLVAGAELRARGGADDGGTRVRAVGAARHHLGPRHGARARRADS